MVGWLLVPTLLLYVWFTFTAWLSFKELQLEGKIEDCCTHFKDIDSINSRINPILLDLTKTSFFRLFKVDLTAKCPFWALNEICKNPKSCGICVCEDKEIPESWKDQDKLHMERGKLVENKLEFFKMIKEVRKADDWGLGEEDSPNAVYVDLVKNVEAFTGYQGQNIWQAIYKDNCFTGPDCLEERVLNRAVSGMHASVSTHLTEYYVDPEIEGYVPNFGMYFEKVGDYPDRIQNLYFAYSILLRGLHIAGDFLRNYTYSAGNFFEDHTTKKIVENLLDISLRHGDVPFDESLLFKDKSKLSAKNQLKNYFANITKLMDCVECEKCKTYGKMQIKGLGTALKLIFDDSSKQSIRLDRNEIIALINTLTKWSTSITVIPKMFDRYHQHNYSVIRIGSFLLLLVIVVSKLMLLAHEQVVIKFRKRINMKAIN